MARKSDNSIFLGTCPVCKKKLKDDDMAVVDESRAVALCYVRCKSCLSSVMFTVTSGAENGVLTAVGILTDIQPDDLEMIRAAKKIDADYVLDVHKFLKKNHEIKSCKKRHQR